MRIRSGNVTFGDSAPTSVEEMKEGEIRITLEGIYGRVGDQILTCDWVTDLHFDDFEDGSISSRWDNIYTESTDPASVVEEDGVLRFSVGPRVGGVNPAVFVNQTTVEAIDWETLGEGVWDFDVWWRVRWHDMETSTADSGMRIRFYFTGGGPSDGGGWQLGFTWSTQNYSISLGSEQDGSGWSNVAGSAINKAAGGQHAWIRLKFKPGVDSRIKFFYHAGPENPQYVGWTEMGAPKNNPDPTGHTNLQVEMRFITADTVDAKTIDIEFIGDYKEVPTTTTTTTTTT
jgi:hypothetical protein